jgi:hypothetical protein
MRLNAAIGTAGKMSATKIVSTVEKAILEIIS